jgi:two-component system, cell cycle response regulator DivK
LPAAGRPLVLIADDIEDVRIICAEYLEHHGYGVATAENGQQALDRALALEPDVVVLDLSMPVLDGLQAARSLKADERTRHIPVIALTAHAMRSSVDEALAAGFDAVITKPCPPQELEAEISRQLARARQSRR